MHCCRKYYGASNRQAYNSRISDRKTALSAMYRVKTIINATISIGMVLLPAYAGVVHKWVEEKGITHYSDEAPVADSSEMTQIELPRTTQVTTAAQGDYYSIANQWERMLKERLERAKLKLEHDRLKAAKREDKPDKIYVREPGETRYVTFYNGYRRHHRPSRKSSSYLNHPNKRLMFKAYPPGLHPGRNRGHGSY
jgi:hypothetical protein